jgi:hypothetical protein
MSGTDFQELSNASDAELLSLLGMHSLSLVQDPQITLEQGRRGEYWVSGPAILGDEGSFEHKSFERIGKLFLKKWSEQLQIAICNNDLLYRELQNKSLAQLGVVVGLITAGIASAVPALAPYTGLLTVLGVFVARSGREAFCSMLRELNSEKEA